MTEERKEEMETTVKKMMDMVNGFPVEEFAKIFEDCLHREHRTIQQKLVKGILTGMLNYAWEETCPDARNEAGVELLKKVSNFLVKENKVYRKQISKDECWEEVCLPFI